VQKNSIDTLIKTKQLLEKIEYVIEYGTQKKYCPCCEEPEDAGHLKECLLKQVKQALEKEADDLVGE